MSGSIVYEKCMWIFSGKGIERKCLKNGKSEWEIIQSKFKFDNSIRIFRLLQNPDISNQFFVFERKCISLISINQNENKPIVKK